MFLPYLFAVGRYIFINIFLILTFSSSASPVCLCKNKLLSSIEGASEQNLLLADEVHGSNGSIWAALGYLLTKVNIMNFWRQKNKMISCSKTRKCFLKLGLGTIRCGIFVWFSFMRSRWLRENKDVDKG